VEEFFGTKQDREIAEANADLEKVSPPEGSMTEAQAVAGMSGGAVAVTAGSNLSSQDPAQAPAPASVAGTKMEGGSGSQLSTALPPVKTKVVLFFLWLHHVL
jgi:hypothetical protein